MKKRKKKTKQTSQTPEPHPALYALGFVPKYSATQFNSCLLICNHINRNLNQCLKWGQIWYPHQDCWNCNTGSSLKFAKPEVAVGLLKKQGLPASVDVDWTEFFQIWREDGSVEGIPFKNAPEQSVLSLEEKFEAVILFFQKDKLYAI